MPTAAGSVIGVSLSGDGFTLAQHAEWFAEVHAVLRKFCGSGWRVSAGTDSEPAQYKVGGFTRPRILEAFERGVSLHRPSGWRASHLWLDYWNAEHVFQVAACADLNESDRQFCAGSIDVQFPNRSKLESDLVLSWFCAIVAIYPAIDGRFGSGALWDGVERALGPPPSGREWTLSGLGWAMRQGGEDAAWALPGGWSETRDGRGGRVIRMADDRIGSVDDESVGLLCDLVRANPRGVKAYTRELVSPPIP